MSNTKPVNILALRNLSHLQNDELCNEIMAANDMAEQFGLTLSRAEAMELVNTRNKSLYDNSRIEIGIGAVKLIIDEFSISTFINSDNYAEILNELLDTFYYVKSETYDKISDCALISLMKDYFEQKCYGSIELLQGRELESLIRSINNNNINNINNDDDDDEFRRDK